MSITKFPELSLSLVCLVKYMCYHLNCSGSWKMNISVQKMNSLTSKEKKERREINEQIRFPVWIDFGTEFALCLPEGGKQIPPTFSNLFSEISQ